MMEQISMYPTKNYHWSRSAHPPLDRQNVAAPADQALSYAPTLSPTFTELTNGMAETPQMVAVSKASLKNCIIVSIAA